MAPLILMKPTDEAPKPDKGRTVSQAARKISLIPISLSPLLLYNPSFLLQRESPKWRFFAISGGHFIRRALFIRQRCPAQRSPQWRPCRAIASRRRKRLGLRWQSGSGDTAFESPTALATKPAPKQPGIRKS